MRVVLLLNLNKKADVSIRQMSVKAGVFMRIVVFSESLAAAGGYQACEDEIH